ncbi:MAG: hypothetical protein KBD07_01335 [Candidatus Omnitrophica bacterium]|nr:hypothetical protein [Candidatus Omnitrophota bacterium]
MSNKTIPLILVMLPVLMFGTMPGSAQTEAHSRVRMTNEDFPTQLRPEPDSLKSIGRIPVSTEIEIKDMRVLQIGNFKENWYLVDFEGKSGWVRGDDLDGEAAEKNFSVTYQAPDFSGGTTSPGGISF